MKHPTPKMITANIARDWPSNGGLWLTTENSEEPDEGATYAITEEEIPAIATACVDWMIEHQAYNPDIKISKG